MSEQELSQAGGEEHGAPGADDRIEDFFKEGELLKRTPVEEVRQRIAEALEYEYHLLREDMQREFPVRVVDAEGKNRLKRAGIAIFDHGQPHTVDHLRRVVICRPEPRNGARGVTRIRAHEQADKELDELWELMQAVPSCEHGLWTNGLDFFFLRKERSRFEDRPRAGIDWPAAEEYVPTQLVESEIRLRQADPPSVPISVIELSSQIVLHRFNSPQWLRNVQKGNAAIIAVATGRESDAALRKAGTSVVVPDLINTARLVEFIRLAR